MPRGVVLVLWAALVVAAALSTEGGGSSASGAVNAYVQRIVLPTEAGDLFYFASEGQAYRDNYPCEQIPVGEYL